MCWHRGPILSLLDSPPIPTGWVGGIRPPDGHACYNCVEYPDASHLGDRMAERRTILIAEDEPDNREVMRSVVEDVGGFRAVLAEDGEQAIELADTEKPDVALLDLLLPRLSGFEVARRLKANPSTAHIPLIAITALGRSRDKMEALEAGAADYVEKPFDVDILLEKIQSVMGPVEMEGATTSGDG